LRYRFPLRFQQGCLYLFRFRKRILRQRLPLPLSPRVMRRPGLRIARKQLHWPVRT
jgi:hypothetical protein